MENQTLTIQELQEALISMPSGTKFSHPYFSKDEYIYRDENGHLKDEEGIFLIEDEFFELRKKSMPDNWFIKNT